MKRFLAIIGIFLFGAVLNFAQDETGLLRFPAVRGSQIVFTYAGDLYTVPTSGGVARRLTSDIGFEMFARFSPDGDAIAFTGQYDGNTEVYLMHAEGGVPVRLTFTETLTRDYVWDRMGPNNVVMAWQDNNTIVYRSRQREANDFKGQLFKVSRDGGLSEQLPLPRGGFCSFSADGKQMVYNRIHREFRTWKRYRGGQADDVWLYDFASKTTTNLTENPAQDIIPMWGGDKIYFLSDRDELKRMNLYVHDLTTGETRKLTDFTEYDVKFPSIGDKALVFENGGYIYHLDLATGQAKKVPITVHEDFAIGRGGLRAVSKSITNYEVAPDGKRALFGARGDVFTVPVKHGITRNLTETSGVHERNSKWSPDGKWVAYISDASGEDEIHIVEQDGKTPASPITSGGDTYKYQPYWSPDSKKLLWSDKKLRLQYVDIASKKVTLVDQATAWEISQYVWSPDSKWIAYTRPEEKSMSTIRVYSLESKKNHEVTEGWFSSNSPAFSADGTFLFFASSRTFSPRMGWTEWNHVYFDMEKLYLVTLSKDTRSPFEPKNDEVTISETSKESKKKGESKEEKDAAVSVEVDPDGLPQRIAELPVSPANYRNLQSIGSTLYYVRQGSKDGKAKLLMYDLDKEKETELGEFSGFEISADGRKMLLGKGGRYAIIDLPTAPVKIKDYLNLSDMKVSLDRHAEWNQIFHESWRQMRDFVYAPNLHDVDWNLMKTRYEVLLPFVNHRADLTYVIGEMIGELNIGHAYVGEGDYPKPKRVKTGLLGAQLDRNPDTGFYRITRILKGQNWDRKLRSPLTEIGVDVREGDYIIAVNGKSTKEMNDIYASFVDKAGKQVVLTVNQQATEAGSRTITVIPTDDETELYYFNWVQANINKVDTATKGRIGYVHIPDMGSKGLNEFVKHYYPQVRKEGLIVDVRGNGGGNVSPQIIERLRREVAMIDIARNTAISLDPGGAMLGPKVMLIDEFSASDGDIVAYRFKKHKLGPVIGKRTWGGVVGIRGTLPLLDGGYLRRPEFSRYDLEGKAWIMEGIGVEPDIVVDNDPPREYEGIDEQLNKAIQIILEELEKNPPKLPPPPGYPDKSK
jgi:tricorn protease